MKKIQECQKMPNLFVSIQTIHKMYECSTCEIDQICQTCKKVCHENHEIKFVATSSFSCNCNQKRSCSLFYCEKHQNFQVKCIACNYKSKNYCRRMRSPEEVDNKRACYTCHTCRITARLCKTCVQQCHKRHDTEFAGKFKHRCVCGGKQNESADLCIFVCSKNYQHPFIVDPPAGCTACLLLDNCFENDQCTFLVTAEQGLDNHENKYQCQRESCDFEVVCQTCKEFCHRHQEESIEIEEDIYQEASVSMLSDDKSPIKNKRPRTIGNSRDTDVYGYGIFEDFIPEQGFYCKCGAGELQAACKAPNKSRGQKISVIKTNEYVQENDEESDEDIYYTYRPIGTRNSENVEEDLYESLEEFDDGELDEDYRYFFLQRIHVE